MLFRSGEARAVRRADADRPTEARSRCLLRGAAAGIIAVPASSCAVVPASEPVARISLRSIRATKRRLTRLFSHDYIPAILLNRGRCHETSFQRSRMRKPACRPRKPAPGRLRASSRTALRPFCKVLAGLGLVKTSSQETRPGAEAIFRDRRKCRDGALGGERVFERKTRHAARRECQ